MSRFLALIVALTMAVSLLPIAGCSNDSDIAKGVVAFSDGELVQSGSIEFRSLDDNSRYAGRITSLGAFRLSDADGRVHLPVGEYEVVVVQVVLTEDLAAADHQHGRTVPRRYADYYTSDLRYSNQADRVDPIHIELDPTP